VITVTTAADDNVANDGSVSLREAIQAINNGTAGADTDISNQNPGVFGVNDTINFNISAAGTVQTINVGGTGNGALPMLIKPMKINGYSEMGASMNTLANGDNAKILIELNGANAGPNADGLLIGATGAGSTIEGLAINRFSLNGIELQGGGATIFGNFVGTNPAGNSAEPNQNDGIHISHSNSSLIGGVLPAARNIVSGNQIDGIHIVGSTLLPATGNEIEGNFVGVNAAGTGSVGIKPVGSFAGTPGGNSVAGIEISSGNANTVGGSTAAARNVVGLNAAGIEVDNGGEGNVVQGNFVGVGADSVTAVGNNLQGIVLRSSDNLAPPLGPGQANEPAVSGNIVGLNPNTNFSGLGDLVEFNGTAGIAVFGNPLPNNATPIQNSGNSILGNSIFENGRSNAAFEAGINLSNQFVFPRDHGVTANDSRGHGAANDPNNFQNFPVLTSISADGTTIVGTLNQSVSANVKYRIEFFVNNPDPLNGVAEGQTFLGAVNVTSNNSGSSSFTFTAPTAVKPGQIVTATATNLTNDPSSQAGSVKIFNTSEFSAGISIKVPPSITSSSSVTFTVGTPGSFNVTATGVPTPALSESGSLPNGVHFTDNGNGTATLTGIPTVAGQFPITISATNGVQPAAMQTFTLTVLTANAAPSLSSASHTAFVEGTAGTFTVTTTGNPRPSLSESGPLPNGVHFTDNGDGTATLTGIPTVAGQFPITISATNGVPPAATQTFTLTVLTAQQRFVQALYLDFLHRGGDLSNPNDAGAWVTALGQGMPAATVTNLIARSAEALGVDVDGLYHRFLGRDADPAGRAAFVGYLQAGGTLEGVSRAMLASPEYQSHFASDASFVQSLYQNLLHRTGSNAEVSGWLALLPQRGRADVAQSFLSSPEFRGAEVRDDYAQLLHRAQPPSAAEVNGWVGSGLDLLTIDTLFAASPEFQMNG
jgi:CSLREA domain-containing protein